MNLDTVKTGSACITCGLSEVLNDVRNLIEPQFAWFCKGHPAGRQKEIPRRRNGRWCHRRIATQNRGMRHAAGMPYLIDDPAACLMHRIGDRAPRRDLGVVV